MHIRWMIRRDLDDVVAIERETREEPWDKQHIIETLHKRNCIGMTVEHNEEVVGYIIYDLHKAFLDVFRYGVKYMDVPARACVFRAIAHKLHSKTSEFGRRRVHINVVDDFDFCKVLIQERFIMDRGVATYYWDYLDSPTDKQFSEMSGDL